MATPPFPGRIVHTRCDGEQELQVVETASSRSLHFGTLSRQSSMWLHAPTRLQLPYTRAMMSFLLFCEQPRAVLLIGLGGGSQAKFLLENFPGCRIDAVEPSSAVVEVAREFFELPHSERLRIHNMHGEAFVAQRPTRRYDAVLLDAFDADGAAPCMQQRSFLSACANRLRAPGGVLAANLWRGRNTGYGASLEAMRQVYGRLPLRLPVGGRGNLIAVAPMDEYQRRDFLDLRSRADQLQRQLGLDFPAYLQTLGDSARLWQRLLARI